MKVVHTPRMAFTRLSSIHVVGAGPSGALLALALAETHSVVLSDLQTAEALASRSRAYAITHSSRRLFSHLGLWEDLLSSLTPFSSLDLRDQGCNQKVIFSLADLDPASRSHGAIGWILDHKPLMELLLNRLGTSENVVLQLGGTCDLPKEPCFVVAADGPRSATRQSWGIKTLEHSYIQGCLTAKVALRGAKQGSAYELFRPEGPLAVLPLSDGSHQVVWSAPLNLCRQRAALAPGPFLDRLASVLPEDIEPDLLLDQPAAIPQQLMFARQFGTRHGVLIGESAHRCHPVGGQGLNLCWRDVSTLVALINKPSNPNRIAWSYQLKRLPDVLLVSLATDQLVRLFSNRLVWLLPLRHLILKCLSGSRALRRLSLRAMTNGPLKALSPLSN